MKKCKTGYYYCNTDKCCKMIPRGWHVGRGGYIEKDEDSKNGNGGNGRGYSGSSGAAGPGAGIYTAPSNFTYQGVASAPSAFGQGGQGARGYYVNHGSGSAGHQSGFGGAGAGGGNAASGADSGGGGASGYSNGSVTIVSAQQGGNNSDLAFAVIRLL